MFFASAWVALLGSWFVMDSNVANTPLAELTLRAIGDSVWSVVWRVVLAIWLWQWMFSEREFHTAWAWFGVVEFAAFLGCLNWMGYLRI